MVTKTPIALPLPAAPGVAAALPGSTPPAPAPSVPAAPAGYLPLPPSPGAAALVDPSPPGAGPAPTRAWILDPYAGCEFACAFCSGRTGPDFDRLVRGAEDLPARLARDLDAGFRPGDSILLGSATDPYQPFEREREITRRCLRVLARREGLRVAVATRSDLVLRDLDLLRVIARRGDLRIDIGVPTLDRRIASVLEPRAPSPQRRLRALRTLAAEGIVAGLDLSPVVPGLTDGHRALEDVVGAAACAGARYLSHRVLRVERPARAAWFALLRRRWPGLLPRHRRLFEGPAAAPADLREAVALRVARARRRHGLEEGPPVARPDPQGLLPFAV